jgi:hypothetical protein
MRFMAFQQLHLSDACLEGLPTGLRPAMQGVVLGAIAKGMASPEAVVAAICSSIRLRMVQAQNRKPSVDTARLDHLLDFIAEHPEDVLAYASWCMAIPPIPPRRHRRRVA